MKSSTIRRSTLSRESMEVIENLAKEQEEGSLGEYYRPDEITQLKEEEYSSKSKEIDLLWQNFKTTQFNTNSPMAYITLGFIIGVVASVVVFTGYNHMVKSGYVAQIPVVQEQTLEDQTTIDSETKVVVPTESDVQSPVEPVSEHVVETVADTSNMTKYVVKDGDTAEAILIRHYGSYTPERAEQVMKANNLKNLDRISIDQVIMLP